MAESVLPQKPEEKRGYIPGRPAVSHPARSAATISSAVTRQRRPASPTSHNPIAAPAGAATAGRVLTAVTSRAEAASSVRSGAKSAPTSRCTDGIPGFRPRFGPARPEKGNSAHYHFVRGITATGDRATCARPRRHIQFGRSVRFHSEMVLLGIARPFRSYFSHPNLELRVILSSWKTPPPLRS